MLLRSVDGNRKNQRLPPRGGIITISAGKQASKQGPSCGVPRRRGFVRVLREDEGKKNSACQIGSNEEEEEFRMIPHSGTARIARQLRATELLAGRLSRKKGGIFLRFFEVALFLQWFEFENKLDVL